MIPLTNIASELLDHHIHPVNMGWESVSIDRHDRQIQLSSDEAIAYIRKNARSNSQILLKMWMEASELSENTGLYPSNDSSRRLFLSAIKHLCKTSGESDHLREIGVHRKLCSMLLCDVTSFSQETMRRMVHYRLAIDWLTHLVSYDLYRVELLECMVKLSKSETTKTAQQYGRDLDIPMGERAHPWWWVKSQLFQSREGDGLGAGEEKSLIEQNHDYRFQQGLEDFDNAKVGNRFYMDHSADGYLWENRDVDGESYSQHTQLGR